MVLVVKYPVDLNPDIALTKSLLDSELNHWVTRHTCTHPIWLRVVWIV